MVFLKNALSKKYLVLKNVCFLLQIELFCPVKQKRVSKLSDGNWTSVFEAGEHRAKFFILILVAATALLTLYFAYYLHKIFNKLSY